MYEHTSAVVGDFDLTVSRFRDNEYEFEIRVLDTPLISDYRRTRVAGQRAAERMLEKFLIKHVRVFKTKAMGYRGASDISFV